MSNGTLSVDIADEASITRAVRQSQKFLKDRGAPQRRSFLVATAISELVRNALIHAGGGSLSLRWIKKEDQRTGIEVVVRDDGPGIENIDLACQEGFSTANSLGLGLPGVIRIMDDVEISSSPGAGCTVEARKWF